MTFSDSLLAAIRKVEPTLTEAVAATRPQDARAAIRASVLAGLATATVAILNLVGAGARARADMDELIRQLPALMGQETVRLDQVILDKALLAEARNHVLGTMATNAPTAISLAYNVCGSTDLTRMLSLDKGPMGPVGGIAAVLSQRLVGEEAASRIMMQTVQAVSALMDAISRPTSTSFTNAPKQGAGCAFAALGILLGVGSAVAGAAVLLQHYA